MKHYFLICAALVCCTILSAKEPKRPDSYNYQRGVEAANDSEFQKAIDYLNRELEDNPKNGYAYTWLAAARASNGDYGKAVTALNYALKYLPKSDKYYIGWTYKMRAIVNLVLEDTIAGLADYNQAIKIDPEQYEYYDQRADLYFDLKRYEEGNADYKKMMKMEPGNVLGYMGYGRNLKECKMYDEAIEQFSYAIKLEPEYSSGYSFRAECYIKQGKIDEALTDLIKAIDLDQDRKAIYELSQLKGENMAPAIAKLKVKIAMNPNVSDWYLYSAFVYETNKQYRKAIDMLQQAQKLDPDTWYDEKIGDCYNEMGYWNEAIMHWDICYQADSTMQEYLMYSARAYFELDSINKSINYANTVIAAQPDVALWYHQRGWYKEKLGLVDDAIEDYTLALSINPEFTYAIYCRARLYKKQGKQDLAEKEFRKILTIDKAPSQTGCTEAAYLLLGDTAHAIMYMDSLVAKDSDNVYDAACLYSLMGDSTRAFEYLRQAFDGGFRRFHHIQLDEDLDPIRSTVGFQQLYNEYWTLYQNELSKEQSSDSINQEVVYEIPFTSAGGVTKVDCTINDLPLNFIFDTGASTVSISMLEANFMFKNGYLTQKDIMGKERYQTADGNISEGTVINLRKINFGGCELTNVRASVTKSQKAPLLLGQTILQRLGKIEIDNERRVIKITTK